MFVYSKQSSNWHLVSYRRYRYIFRVSSPGPQSNSRTNTHTQIKRNTKRRILGPTRPREEYPASFELPQPHRRNTSNPRLRNPPPFTYYVFLLHVDGNEADSLSLFLPLSMGMDWTNTLDSEGMESDEYERQIPKGCCAD